MARYPHFMFRLLAPMAVFLAAAFCCFDWLAYWIGPFAILVYVAGSFTSLVLGAMWAEGLYE